MPEGARVRSHDHTSRATVDGRRFESRVREFDLPFENGWTIAVRWNGHGIAGAWNFVDEPEAGVVRVTGRDGRVVVWDGARRSDDRWTTAVSDSVSPTERSSI